MQKREWGGLRQYGGLPQPSLRLARGGPPLLPPPQYSYNRKSFLPFVNVMRGERAYLLGMQVGAFELVTGVRERGNLWESMQPCWKPLEWG